MEQTAVNWLVEQFDLEMQDDFHLTKIKQAKEMEEQQIKEAYTEGTFEKMRHLDGKDFMMPTEYYNKTFKSE